MIFIKYSTKGHIFCKECILENLLQQKKDIAKRKSIIEQEKEKEKVLKILILKNRLKKKRKKKN